MIRIINVICEPVKYGLGNIYFRNSKTERRKHSGEETRLIRRRMRDKTSLGPLKNPRETTIDTLIDNSNDSVCIMQSLRHITHSCNLAQLSMTRENKRVNNSRVRTL